MEAILYTSNTGTAERYARMIGEKIGLPVYSLGSEPQKTGAEILYVGWIMAGNVRGYKEAAKKYAVKALCGVGMGETGSQLAELRKANSVGDDTPVFSLQGGFDIKKLHGIYKLMMGIMKKTAGKSLAAKANRTPQEDDMLDMLLHGGDRVSEKNLDALLQWYGQQKQGK